MRPREGTVAEYTIRRTSTPSRVFRVAFPDGELVGDITPFAFRYNVSKADDFFVESKTLLFSVVPSIENGPDSLIRIPLALAETVFPQDVYKGMVIWREDGTDPVYPVVPDDFMRLDLVIDEKARVP